VFKGVLNGVLNCVKQECQSLFKVVVHGMCTEELKSVSKSVFNSVLKYQSKHY
jgi:hypothetical protein